MTALEQLNGYVKRLESRLRLFAASRGAIVTAAMALALTVLFVWISNRNQFAQRVVLPLRIVLFLAVAAAISFALALPLLKLTRRRVTRLAEQRIPSFEERLLTVEERHDPSNPFTELLAEDAMRVARQHQPEELTPTRSLLGMLAGGVVAAAVLFWLIAAGPGYWGYGASLLWTGSANPGKRPLYDIAVQPGDKTIRRKSDQMITAQLFNFSAHSVTLHARYGGALKWESIPMQEQRSSNGYQFLFAGLSDPVEYYVQADGAQSKRFRIGVKDLPGVKRVKVALRFPSGLGLKNIVQDPGGDIRAVDGSQAEISILTDRFLPHGVLVLEDGTKMSLAKGEGNWSTVSMPIKKDGSYHIAAIDEGETIRISDDYFIEAKKDEPSTVRILKPGRDPKVSPIEELPITVDAADDFGIDGMDLHYSVNGSPEKVVPLLKSKGVKEAQGSTTIYLEDYKLSPGDVISMYATARDAKTTSRSDIVFAQAEPFDFKFSQSQQAGGGGGMGMGGGQDNDISERQKQIIAATWNQLRPGEKARTALQETAKFLSDVEGKLSEQAKTLADRMASRELGSSGSQFANFSKLMTDASSQMNDAVSQLKPGKWHDALTPEQKALQSLLRAESLFRDIQVAFGQQGGGGGGGGAQRDLARMFDLELDTSKNQYETGKSQSQNGGDQQKAIDEAFQKLQELARRQQELAAQNQQQQAWEQRWQEEQLRREAEELRRQMQQLAQNQQQNQSGNNSQQQQEGQQSQQGQQGGQSGGQQSASSQGRSGQMSGRSQANAQQNRQMAEAMRQAMQALQQAQDEMRKAVTDRDHTAQQRAGDRLAEAQKALRDALHQQAGSSTGDLAQRAQDIANAQRDIANRMREMYGERSLRGRMGNQMSQSGGGENEMPQMNDPVNPGYGSGYFRRRYFQPEPGRQATPQEKELAAQKEKLAQQLQSLQREMQRQEQNLAGAQPDASSKMRKALSDAEQRELSMRMQKYAEWMREGYGERNLDAEDSVTAGLDQLTRQLNEVQQALQDGQQPGSPGAEQSREARALSQVRALREQLERAGQRGQQNGRQSPGQQSGQNGQQQAQNGQQGQSGQASQSVQPQNGQAGDPNSWSPQGDLGNPGIDRQGLQSAMGNLYALRGQIDPRDRALYGDLNGTLGYLRNLNADPGKLQSTIGQDAITSLERLEIELNRRVGEQAAAGARTGAAEASPEKYRDAVAQYFKKLSQPK